MKNKLLILAGVASAMALATSVQANPIPAGSSVSMSGTATLDNQALGSATKANSISSVTVGGTPTGAFAGTAGDSVTWVGFGWNPSTAPVATLWTYTDVGLGMTYSFDLSSLTVVSQDNYFLNLTGDGTLYATGYDPTPGAWSFTISNPTGGSAVNYDFTFANSQTSVPDGGMTAMMLGMALSGLGLLFGRKARAA